MIINEDEQQEQTMTTFSGRCQWLVEWIEELEMGFNI